MTGDVLEGLPRYRLSPPHSLRERVCSNAYDIRRTLLITDVFLHNLSDSCVDAQYGLKAQKWLSTADVRLFRSLVYFTPQVCRSLLVSLDEDQTS